VCGQNARRRTRGVINVSSSLVAGKTVMKGKAKEKPVRVYAVMYVDKNASHGTQSTLDYDKRDVQRWKSKEMLSTGQARNHEYAKGSAQSISLGYPGIAGGLRSMSMRG
jgi:hypothetical protein